jgi:hypothetical protein
MNYFGTYNIDWADLIADAKEEDADPMEYVDEWADELNGNCEECGESLQVRSQDNGSYMPDQVGYCQSCDIYYS